MAQHMLELNMALLPAGEERATRCKDKWEARARRATGVLANARLLCLDAPHKTTSPFSWQCPLQRAQGREHGDTLWRGRAPSPPSPARLWSSSSSLAIALLEEASSVSTWIFSSIGCSLGLPKAKTRMETSHFVGKNSRQGWVFSLVSAFSFFLFLSLVTNGNSLP